MVNLDIDQLEQHGYTLVPGFLDAQMTRRAGQRS